MFPDDGAVTSSRRAGLLVPVVVLGSNVAVYLVQLAAAHLLDSAEYGTFAAFASITAIGSVAANAVQTMAARRTAAGQDRGLERSALVVAAVVGMVVLLATPVLSLFLHLDDWLGLAYVAVTLAALALCGVWQGVEQGRRRFAGFAALLGLLAVLRMAGGVAGVAVGRSADWGAGGTALGCVLAAAGCAALARRRGVSTPSHRAREVASALRETAHAAHGHGALLVLSSIDVLLARHALGANAAGRYAAATLVERGALWLPLPVITLLFAELAVARTHAAALRRGLTVVALLGCAATAGVALLSPVALVAIGGDKYADVQGLLWVFAAAGSAMAVVQFGVVAGLAVRARARLAAVWAVVAGVVVVALARGSALTPGALVTVVAIGGVVLAVVTAAAAAVTARRLAAGQPVGSAGQGGAS